MASDSGVGATEELSLRVSVATLVRVVFQSLEDGVCMLALERKATLRGAESGRVVEIKAQPFGGAVHIRDVKALRSLIGDFHFDNERSCSEEDFRIFIKPSKWEAVRELCIREFSLVNDTIVETDPDRELAEEFADAMKIRLESNQISRKPIATVVENSPAPAENFYAEGYPTARIYRVFEARISDPALALTMLTNSEGISDRDLRELALEDVRKGGKGWANATLALPLKSIGDFYLAMSLQQRNSSVVFEENRLADTVPAILEGIDVPKYQRLE